MRADAGAAGGCQDDRIAPGHGVWEEAESDQRPQI